MKKEKIEEYIKKIDESFHVDYEFFLTSDNYREAVSPLEGCRIATGASKIVFIFDDCDYVFKVPFEGLANDDWDPDDEDSPEFFDFCEAYAGFAITDYDYCYAESLYYQDAKELNLNQFFAETKKVGYVNKLRPIYMQPKCSLFNYDYSESDKKATVKDSDDAEEFCDEIEKDCFNARWIAEAILTYGYEIVEKLLDFIEDYGINDLHEGNIGYLHGVPILVDYSAFDD